MESKLNKARSVLNEFTTTIDGMRSKRDQKVAEVDEATLKLEVEESFSGLPLNFHSETSNVKLLHKNHSNNNNNRSFIWRRKLACEGV